MRILILSGIVLSALSLCTAQETSDQQAITQLIEDFRTISIADDAGHRVASLLGDGYIHITPDGTMTKSWRIAPKSESQPIMMEELHIRVFDNVAVAAYLWRVRDEKITSAVMQVLQKG